MNKPELLLQPPATQAQEPATSGDKPVLVIQSGSTTKEYWLDIWRHRELLLFLAWRDILVRYKQTVIGVSWVLIRPLLTMLLLTVVFGRIARLPSDNTPYSILVFTGLLPWFFFSNAVSECSNSLLTNGHLLSKVYFPRLIVPTSTILVSSVDFVISIAVLVLLMFWYGIVPTWHLLLLPVLGVMVGVLSLGLGLWFSSLTVRYRDFRHLVPFVLQLGIYASPVGYTTKIIPEKWLHLYYLNPVAGIIDCFRWAIIGSAVNVYGVIVSLTVTTALLITGVLYFRTEEARFADDI
jgi:lipopolysaccharide transport system permease protein